MGMRISQVDAFTNRRFAGNPAAVCVLTEPADETWMQAVAGEMNLSETAFAQRLGSGSKFNLRGLRPKMKSTCAVTQRWRQPTFSGKKAIFRPDEPAALRRPKRPFDRQSRPRWNRARFSGRTRSRRGQRRRRARRTVARLGATVSSPAAIASTFWSNSKPVAV